MKEKVKIQLSTRERKFRWFYASLVILPLLQFAVFYGYVNFNSFKLAFWSYGLNELATSFEYTFAGLDNFKEAFSILSSSPYLIENSVYYFLISAFIGLSLSLAFSFYIYKGYFLSKFFKVILFLPNVISGIIFSFLFKYVVTDVYKEIVFMISGETVLGLLDNIDTRLATVYFYNIWVSFGIYMLMFSGAMSGISDEIVEACELDGANLVQEFWYITVPMIFPTFSSLFVIAMTGIFGNQLSLHSLYQGDKGVSFGTIGYYIFFHSANLVNFEVTKPTMSELSALGLILSFIMVPLTLIVRRLLEKFGPKES